MRNSRTYSVKKVKIYFQTKINFQTKQMKKYTMNKSLKKLFQLETKTSMENSNTDQNDEKCHRPFWPGTLSTSLLQRLLTFQHLTLAIPRYIISIQHKCFNLFFKMHMWWRIAVATGVFKVCNSSILVLSITRWLL